MQFCMIAGGCVRNSYSSPQVQEDLFALISIPCALYHMPSDFCPRLFAPANCYASAGGLPLDLART